MSAQLIQRTIPTDPEAASGLLEDVVKASAEAGWNMEAQFALRMGLDEAVSNAMRHGNKGDRGKNIEVEVRIEGRQAHLRVRDEGAGFDPSTVPDPREPENLERPGGRGLLLIRSYMKEVFWNAKGNEIRLLLEIPA